MRLSCENNIVLEKTNISAIVCVPEAKLIFAHNFLPNSTNKQQNPPPPPKELHIYLESQLQSFWIGVRSHRSEVHNVIISAFLNSCLISLHYYAVNLCRVSSYSRYIWSSPQCPFNMPVVFNLRPRHNLDLYFPSLPRTIHHMVVHFPQHSPDASVHKYSHLHWRGLP